MKGLDAYVQRISSPYVRLPGLFEKLRFTVVRTTGKAGGVESGSPGFFSTSPTPPGIRLGVAGGLQSLSGRSRIQIENDVFDFK